MIRGDAEGETAPSNASPPSASAPVIVPKDANPTNVGSKPLAVRPTVGAAGAAESAASANRARCSSDAPVAATSQQTQPATPPPPNVAQLEAPRGACLPSDSFSRAQTPPRSAAPTKPPSAGSENCFQSRSSSGRTRRRPYSARSSRRGARVSLDDRLDSLQESWVRPGTPGITIGVSGAFPEMDLSQEERRRKTYRPGGALNNIGYADASEA